MKTEAMFREILEKANEGIREIPELKDMDLSVWLRWEEFLRAIWVHGFSSAMTVIEKTDTSFDTRKMMDRAADDLASWAFSPEERKEILSDGPDR